MFPPFVLGEVVRLTAPKSNPSEDEKTTEASGDAERPALGRILIPQIGGAAPGNDYISMDGETGSLRPPAPEHGSVSRGQGRRASRRPLDSASILGPSLSEQVERTLRRATRPKTKPISPEHLDARARAGGRDRVLIVDDSDLARAAMTRMLRAAGFEVFDMDSPLGVTRAVLQDDIDVVVVDVQMPAMRGDRVVELFRKSPRLRSLPIILVSGESEEDLQTLAAEHGANATVAKDHIANLSNVIREVMARARTGTER